VDDGKIQNAINKCKGIWASLPGAGDGQRENKLDDLLIAYHNAGGTVA
jgi:muramidase (phage lysozyme)